MNNARNQLWTYLNTHNDNELQRTEIIAMLKQIDNEQAAAVAAEREACWKIALDIATKQYDNEQAVQIYDAIRARNGNGGKGE